MTRNRLRRGLVTAAVSGGIVGAALAALVHERDASPRQSVGVGTSALPAPVERAFTVATPRPLRDPQTTVQWAPVERVTVARVSPRDASREAATLEPRTPEGTANLVLVLGRARDASGRLWIRARLPVLPNNTTGWVPRAALGGYTEVRTRLTVDLRGLVATLTRDGRPIFRARIGVGRPAWPTPRGEFYVRSKLTAYRSAFYGPVAFGTSARSETLTDWPAGGFVGIHGTNRPDLLPGYVSHGCIRLRNGDILRLARLMPVGTPLTIR